MTAGRFNVDPRINAAIERTFETHPYYATAVTRLRITPDANVPTMATSAEWVTHYNPATVAGWTRDETAAVIVHELEHLLRDHNGRCGDRDHGQWNVTADAEINQRLPGLPAGAVYPSTLSLPERLTAETMYALNGGKRGEPEPEPGAGDGDGGSGEGSGDGAGAPGDGPDCGSAAGGATRPWEANDERQPGAGAANGGDDARKDVARSIMGGAAAGTADADELREWAETELGIDRAGWYRALAAAVGHTMAPFGAPTRWVWPGRRDIRDMGGAMVPRWTGERPSCAVVIDTSGSITQLDIEMAVAAAHYIGRMADIRVYGCNTQVVDYGTTVPERIRGGGGTNMGVGIGRAIADGAKAVVVITDCETPWPENAGVAVIIGANASASTYGVPDWMTVLPIMAETD
jgi:hypothetical protein